MPSPIRLPLRYVLPPLNDMNARSMALLSFLALSTCTTIALEPSVEASPSGWFHDASEVDAKRPNVLDTVSGAELSSGWKCAGLVEFESMARRMNRMPD